MSELIDKKALMDALGIAVECAGCSFNEHHFCTKSNDFVIACEAITDAVPVNHWIPCSERLPEDEEKVLCCTITTKGIKNIVIGYDAERWCCGMNSNVIAWMPLPEMYIENK